MVAKYPIDRSLAFTALLELAPEAFGRREVRSGSAAITRFLEDFYGQPGEPELNMFEYARTWLAQGGLEKGEADADQVHRD